MDSFSTVMTEAKYQELKEKGNSHFKKGEWPEAVGCYTECIALMPDEVASYTNRALCYLRLAEPLLAERDCSLALELDGKNVKALYRRGKANKALSHFKHGVRDLKQLLEIDPQNSDAQKEFESMKDLWREQMQAMQVEDKNTLERDAEGELYLPNNTQEIIEYIEDLQDVSMPVEMGYLVEALYTWVLESIELTQSKCYKESLQAIKKAREISVMLGEVDIVLPFLSRLTCRAHYGMGMALHALLDLYCAFVDWVAEDYFWLEVVRRFILQMDLSKHLQDLRDVLEQFLNIGAVLFEEGFLSPAATMFREGYQLANLAVCDFKVGVGNEPNQLSPKVLESLVAGLAHISVLQEDIRNARIWIKRAQEYTDYTSGFGYALSSTICLLENDPNNAMEFWKQASMFKTDGLELTLEKISQRIEQELTKQNERKVEIEENWFNSLQTPRSTGRQTPSKNKERVVQTSTKSPPNRESECETHIKRKTKEKKKRKSTLTLETYHASESQSIATPATPDTDITPGGSVEAGRGEERPSVSTSNSFSALDPAFNWRNFAISPTSHHGSERGDTVTVPNSMLNPDTLRSPPGCSSKQKKERSRENVISKPSPRGNTVKDIHASFPLSKSHDVRLACEKCYDCCSSQYDTHLSHVCNENILLTKISSSKKDWKQIRQRRFHEPITGGYIMCTYHTQGNYSKESLGNCSFAHNAAELKIWNLEMNNKFNIANFINDLKQSKNYKRFNPIFFLDKYPGSLHFICEQCYVKVPSKISKKVRHKPQCVGGHTWQGNIGLIIHEKREGTNIQHSVIKTRPDKSPGAKFYECQNEECCNDECPNAHSTIERHFWMLEMDAQMARKDLVQLANTQTSGGSKVSDRGFLGFGCESQGAANQQATKDKNTQSLVHAFMPSFFSMGTTELDDQMPVWEFGESIQLVCKQCFKDGQVNSISQKNPNKCSGGKHGMNEWTTVCVFRSKENKWEKIGHLPQTGTGVDRFRMCMRKSTYGNCTVSGCTFAHNESEILVWGWMKRNNVLTLAEVIDIATPVSAEKCTAPSEAIDPSGDSGPTTLKQRLPHHIPLRHGTYYCEYCNIECDNHANLERHLSSKRHREKLMQMPTGVIYEHRQPPLRVQNDDYILCPQHQEGKCIYSGKADDLNFCTRAHSEEELAEWRYRKKLVTQRQQKARKKGFMSYSDQLLDDYHTTDDKTKVMMEDDVVQDVELTCDQTLKQVMTEKKSFTWKFQLQTKGGPSLKKVALLLPNARDFFGITGTDDPQTASGEEVCTDEDVGSYEVDVTFSTEVFGTFEQWVIFDFGTRPTMLKKLRMDICSKQLEKEVAKIQKRTPKFSTHNSTIIPYSDDNNVICELLKDEPILNNTHQSRSLQAASQVLTKTNYKQVLHQRISIEEDERDTLVSMLNVTSGEVQLRRKLQVGSISLEAKDGELLTAVQIPEIFKYETCAGHLLLTDIKSALICRYDKPERTRTINKHYEARIYQSGDYQIGTNRDTVILQLSKTCCQEMLLEDGAVVKLRVQFQLDHSNFQLMHWAVENVNPHLLYPDLAAINPAFQSSLGGELRTKTLTKKQVDIVKYLISDHAKNSPPFIVYGPFGTGKTFTLCQAAVAIARQPGKRVLLCTLSNSSSDLYITRYLYNLVEKEGGDKIRPLRLLLENPTCNSVDPKVLTFCQLSQDEKYVCLPTKEQVQSHNIVIATLEASIFLRKQLKLYGHFTHIIIDEAAEAMEPETLMAMTLASENTVVILAGDHRQISPRFYSKALQKNHIKLTLLQRLFDHYQTHSHGQHYLRLLTDNFRCCQPILNFVSRMFYGGNVNSASSASFSEKFPPLSFYMAKGTECKDAEDATYYNVAEVLEVVERVYQVWSNWPTEWKNRAAEKIAVLVPYLSQVRRIREILHKRNPELADVTVDIVENVLGKEFKAVFISTVHTENFDQDWKQLHLGFLSDLHLLNTALSRAECFIGVVGDPFALCTIGACKMVWQEYLKICAQPNSCQPEGYLTIEWLQSLEVSTSNISMQSPIRCILNPAQQCISSVPKEVEASQHSSYITDQMPPESSFFSNHDEDDYDDDEIETDMILALLAKEVSSSAASNHSTHTDQIEQEDITCVKFEAYKPQLEELLPSLQYSNEQLRRNKRVSAYDEEEDYDSMSDDDDDYDISSEDGDDIHGASRTRYPPVYEELDNKEILEQKINQDPNVFKRAIIHLVNSQHAFCTPTEDENIDRIDIHGRRKAGQAFNGDEVVVELLETEGTIRKGKVRGILKTSRGAGDKYTKFVCTPDNYHGNLMIPRCKTVPKIHIHDAAVRNSMKIPKHVKPYMVPIYRFTKKHGLKLDRFVKLERGKRENQVFIVRFLKWDVSHIYPLGVVVGILPCGIDLKSGCDILNEQYSIPHKYHQDTLDQADDLNTFQPEEDCRKDLRNLLTFTIDPEESKDLDDALSIENLQDGMHRIGIHIADVSSFIRKGDPIDFEAKQRVTSFYPPGRPSIGMIPDCLSQGRVSLLPQQDRWAISVFFKVSSSGEVLPYDEEDQIVQSIIRSRYQLNYEEVQAMIDGTTGEPNGVYEFVEDKIKALHQITNSLRRQRLGKGYFHWEFIDEEFHEDAGEAHALVEELMILANTHIGSTIMKEFPQQTPLRIQQSPKLATIRDWLQKHGEMAQLSYKLKQLLLSFPQNLSHDYISLDTTRIKIKQSLWQELLAAMEQNDLRRITKLSFAPEEYPQTALSLMCWYQAQHQAKYVCSDWGMSDTKDQLHFSLNCNTYVHFTSPLRRHIDIVVHRLLLATLNVQQHEEPPYSTVEIQEICQQVNRVSERAKKYDKSCKLLMKSIQCASIPIEKMAVVDKIDDREISVMYPHIKNTLSTSCSLKLNALDLSAKPILNKETGEKLVLKWQKRLYSNAGFHPQAVEPRLAEQRGCQKLDPDKDVIVLEKCFMQNIQSEVEKGEFRRAKERLLDMNNSMSMSERDGYAPEVTSEVKQGHKILRHHCEFSLEVESGNTLQIQLSAQLNRGLLQPIPQLLHLTKSVKLCLEHTTRPVEAFADIANHGTRQKYTDLDEYGNIWLSILEMEAAYSISDCDQNSLISQVTITWEPTDKRRQSLCGRFKLNVAFLQERHVECLLPVPGEDNSSDAYICVRCEVPASKLNPVSTSSYADKEDLDSISCLSDSSSNPSEISESIDPSGTSESINPSETSELIDHSDIEPTDEEDQTANAELGKYNTQVFWIGHGHIINIEESKDKAWSIVEFSLHHSHLPLPQYCMDKPRICTIEVIPADKTYIKQKKTIGDLKDTTDLAKAICLGNKLPENENKLAKDVKDVNIFENRYLPYANYMQKEAVNKALRQPFTLIQGPPGTGKTITGVRLVYWFIQMNRRIQEAPGKQKQIFYCGPSNKSVDVVAKLLRERFIDMSRDDRPRILRVYGKTYRKKDFPEDPREPRGPKSSNTLNSQVCPDLIDITLHHLIRRDGKKYSKDIKEFDARIAKAMRFPGRETITHEEIVRFKGLLLAAEREELEKYEVILCTCATSRSGRFVDKTDKPIARVQQVIVDESGMCTEPLSLIPMIATSAEQVILIGDHKQLRPIVKNDLAKDLGLEKSLFERYKDSAIMLRKQYRMHPSICDFPSKAFYDGLLETGESVAWMGREGDKPLGIWPGGDSQRIVFCHVEGKEEILTVSTAEGNEQSRSNAKEIEQVVRIYKRLFHKHKVSPKYMTVLSQYKSQVAKIEEELKKFTQQPLVGTVVSSQGGEWDYVILSTVRSLPQEVLEEKKPSIGWRKKNMGFITDQNQINVAITRARKGLIIIGNKHLLACDPLWKRLLQHYQDRNCVVDAENFLKR